MTRDATACEMLLEDINYMSCTISSMQYEIWKERNLFLSSVFLDAKKFGDLTFLLLISDWLIIIPSKRHSALFLYLSQDRPCSNTDNIFLCGPRLAPTT